MYVYEVIPITRNPSTPKTLSYFSAKSFKRGDLVKADLRGKEIFAVVKTASGLDDLKAELKKQTFRLKPLRFLIQENFFSDQWFDTLSRLSREFILPEGLILAKLWPKALLSKNQERPPVEINKEKGTHQKFAARGSNEERIQFYRGLVREHFARRKSLMLLSPKIETLKNLAQELSRGIENYVFFFHSDLPSKKYLESWKRALAANHPLLVLGTGQTLVFDRPDLETIVVEEEGSRLWKEWEGRPFNFRKAAETIAETRGLKLILADEIPALETIWEAGSGRIEALEPLTARLQSHIETRLIELEKNQGGFSWISPELQSELEESIFKNERILLFANRKGYGAFTVCQDCGRNILCPSCSVPLVLHGLKRDDRKFLCRHCLQVLPVPERCGHCFSWKLKEFGLGLEKIQEEFQKLFPKKPNNVVFATELVISSYGPEFDLVSIVSLDHLFSIPDFRINERIFRLVTALKSITRRKIILQTRLSGSRLLQDALSGNLSRFYQEEIAARKKFSYPPFIRLIKLTKEDKDYGNIKKAETEASNLLKACQPLSFPAFLEKIKNRYRWNIILKIPRENWPPEKNLYEILSNLAPAGWEIIVDPESIT